MNQKSESNLLTDIKERLLNRAAHAVIIKDKPNLYYDAAYEIEKQAKRIAELEAALKPFDEMLQRDFSIMSDDERYDDDFTAKVLMRLGDLRAARKVLGEKK